MKRSLRSELLSAAVPIVYGLGAALHALARRVPEWQWVTWKLVEEPAVLERYEQERRRDGRPFPEECYRSGYELAFDVDSTPVQYAHICGTYPTGALCGTKLLWFHAGPLTPAKFEKVNCPTCLDLWKGRGLVLDGGGE